MLPLHFYCIFKVKFKVKPSNAFWDWAEPMVASAAIRQKIQIERAYGIQSLHCLKEVLLQEGRSLSSMPVMNQKLDLLCSI